jgi:ATP-grasp in the biosynthetic pathway with Ter operon
LNYEYPENRPECKLPDAGRYNGWLSSRKKVLVFPCGSEIGLEIQRALRFSIHFDLLGASSVSSNHGKYVYDGYVEGLPWIEDPRFLEECNRVIDEHQVDFVFPAHDSVVLSLAECAGALHACYVGSPAATCRICRSKRATYRRLEGRVRVPRVFAPEETPPGYPVFLKPDSGQGSRGVHLANSPEEVAFYLRQDPALLVLEHLPGAEYTVDCFTDRHGVLRFAGARERLRIMNGISVDTAPVEGRGFQEIAETINAALRFRGVWFFQVKRTAAGELALLEIAPRVSGSMALYRNLGVNYALLALFDQMDQDVDLVRNQYPIRMDRALFSRFSLDLHYEDVYIDLDDTVIRDGQVNPLAAAFLYQCRNRGVRLHVLSRHAGDLHATLRLLALEALFDTVVRVPDARCKSEYIQGGAAIFIDDSFAERKRVHDRLGIPTFAADALESLMGGSL